VQLYSCSELSRTGQSSTAAFFRALLGAEGIIERPEWRWFSKEKGVAASLVSYIGGGVQLYRRWCSTCEPEQGALFPRKTLLNEAATVAETMAPLVALRYSLNTDTRHRLTSEKRKERG
jgi:hypothetical protein